MAGPIPAQPVAPPGTQPSPRLRAAARTTPVPPTSHRPPGPPPNREAPTKPQPRTPHEHAADSQTARTPHTPTPDRSGQTSKKDQEDGQALPRRASDSHARCPGTGIGGKHGHAGDQHCPGLYGTQARPDQQPRRKSRDEPAPSAEHSGTSGQAPTDQRWTPQQINSKHDRHGRNSEIQFSGPDSPRPCHPPTATTTVRTGKAPHRS